MKTSWAPSMRSLSGWDRFKTRLWELVEKTETFVARLPGAKFTVSAAAETLGESIKRLSPAGTTYNHKKVGMK